MDPVLAVMSVFAVLLMLIVAAPVVVRIIVIELDARRRAELRVLARRAGWAVEPRPDRRLQRRYHGKPFLRFGRGRVKDLVRGEHRGRAFLAFQFSYSRSTTQGSSRTYFFTHVATPLPGPAPRVEISLRQAGGRIAALFRARTVELGNPVFDARYVVRSDDPAFAYALLQSGLARWLMGVPDPGSLVVDGSELRAWKGGALKAETFPRLLDYLCAAMEQVPPYVWTPPHGAVPGNPAYCRGV